MKTLSIITGLALALSLTACAHKMPNPPDDPIIPDETEPERIEEPSPEPSPEPGMTIDIGLPGWEMVDANDDQFTFFNRATNSTIELNFWPGDIIDGPERIINSIHQRLQMINSAIMSPIEFSQDKSVAYFSFSTKPGEEESVYKGKVVVLLMPEQPKAIAICLGYWPASVDEQMITDFDRFWVGINTAAALIDPPEDTK